MQINPHNPTVLEARLVALEAELRRINERISGLEARPVPELLSPREAEAAALIQPGEGDPRD